MSTIYNLDDFTLSGAHLSDTTTEVTITAIPQNVTEYDYIDLGTGAVTVNNYLDFELVASAGTGTGAKYHGVGFTDSLAAFNVSPNVAQFCYQFDSANALWFTYAYLRESSVYHGANEAVGIAVSATRYYPRLSILSCIGGQYGGLLSQVFTDSGRTTLSKSVQVARQAAGTYSHLYAFHSFAGGSTQTTTSKIANLVQTTVSAGENLSTEFTENDTAANDIAVFPDIAVVTTMASNIEARIVKDGGAGYYSGDYVIREVLHVTAQSGSGAEFGCMCVSNTATDNDNKTNDKHFVDATYNASTNLYLKLVEYSGGTRYPSSSQIVYTYGTDGPLFLERRRVRAEGTYGRLHLQAYSDPAFTIALGAEITLDLHEDINFRYYMPVMSRNGASAATSTFTIGGVSTSSGYQITATKGAFGLAGKSASLVAQAVVANIGAFGFAGKTVSFKTLLASTKGAFGLAGKFSNISTGNSLSSTKGAFGFAGISVNFAHSIVITKGAFGFAGKTSILGSAVTSLRTCTITKWDATTETEIPATGLTGVYYLLYEPSTGKIMDHSDSTFKNPDACTTPQGTMTERVLLDSLGNNLTEGVYDILISTTGLSGQYQEFALYEGAFNYRNSNSVRFQDGVEYLGGLTVPENTQLMSGIPDAVWNGITIP